jgi:hypothetical protein
LDLARNKTMAKGSAEVLCCWGSRLSTVRNTSNLGTYPDN